MTENWPLYVGVEVGSTRTQEIFSNFHVKFSSLTSPDTLVVQVSDSTTVIKQPQTKPGPPLHAVPQQDKETATT